MTEAPTDRPEPAIRKPGRGLRIALAVSLALNLAVLGVVGGAMVKSGGKRPAAIHELGFGPFTDALTREQRGELRKSFAARGPGFRALRREMREDADVILATLRAEPFAPDEFAARLRQMSDRLSGRMRDSEQLLVGLVAAMSPADRAAFADRLQAGMEEGARGGRKDGQPDQPPGPGEMPPPASPPEN